MPRGACPKCKEGVMREQDLSHGLSVSSNDFQINHFPLLTFCCDRCGYTEFYATGFEPV